MNERKNSVTRTPLPLSSRPPLRQRGVVLIISLILLVVLTLLGVASLNTTTLQEKMSSGIQEVNRAFQAGESGLDDAFNDANAFDLNAPVTGKTALLGPYGAGANYSVQFVQTSNPPVGSLYSASSFSSYHFRMDATAGSRVTDPGGNGALTIDSNAAEVVLAGGAYQIGPKAN